MPKSNYNTGFPGGVTIRNVPILDLQNGDGNVFWVDNKKWNASDLNRGTFKFPFKTLKKAISFCKPNKGDKILIAAGHYEIITDDTTFNASIDGIQIFGLGSSDSRPIFSFQDEITAKTVISGSDVYIGNIIFQCDIPLQERMIEVTGKRFIIENCLLREGIEPGLRFIVLAGSEPNTCDGFKTIDCEFINESPSIYRSAIEFVTQIDDPQIINCYANGYFVESIIHNNFATGGNITDILIDQGNYENHTPDKRIIELHHDQSGIISEGISMRANTNLLPVYTEKVSEKNNGDVLVLTNYIPVSSITTTGTAITAPISGEVVIEQILLETDATPITGATSIQIFKTLINYGSAVVLEETVGNLGANVTIDLDTASVKGIRANIKNNSALEIRATGANAIGSEVKVTLVLRVKVPGSVREWPHA